MGEHLVKRVNALDCDARLIVGDSNGRARTVAESNGYQSAYATAGDSAMGAGGPIITAHNDEFHWCGELDFIWYSRASLILNGVAQVPREERLVPGRLTTHPKESLPRPGWPS